jgi:hypothetical protein
MNTLLLLFLSVYLDLCGYIIKIAIDDDFAEYHLRRIPFIWAFYSLNQKAKI